jgi:hypothetical protein
MAHDGRSIAEERKGGITTKGRSVRRLRVAGPRTMYKLGMRSAPRAMIAMFESLEDAVMPFDYERLHRI